MERFIRFLFGRVEKLNMFLLSWREMWLPIDTMCTAGDLRDEIGTAVLFCELDRFRDL